MYVYVSASKILVQQFASFLIVKLLKDSGILLQQKEYHFPYIGEARDKVIVEVNGEEILVRNDGNGKVYKRLNNSGVEFCKKLVEGNLQLS